MLPKQLIGGIQIEVKTSKFSSLNAGIYQWAKWL